MDDENKQNKTELRPAEEVFCRLFAGNGNYFNNATRSYGIAYERELPSEEKTVSEWNIEEKREYNLAGVEGARLVKKPKIRKRCEELLLEEFKDEIADKELAWVLKQRNDLGAKMNAIKEYNKLKQRITEKLELSGQININNILNELSDSNSEEKSK